MISLNTTPHTSTRNLPQPTHFTPSPRTARQSTREMKVYTKTVPDQPDSQLTLPPTTTALVIKKQVK